MSDSTDSTTLSSALCACCMTWIEKSKHWPTCLKHRGRILAEIRARIAAASKAGDIAAEVQAMREAHRAVGGWMR